MTLIVSMYVLSLLLGLQSQKYKKHPFWSHLCFGVGLFNFVFATVSLAFWRFVG